MAAVTSLFLRLAPGGKRPLHEQIHAGLRARILSGELPRGARLPSSRQLARDLGVARSTVLEALEPLQAEGFLVTRPWSSTRVAPELPQPPAKSAAARPGLPARPPRVSAAARALAAMPAGAPRLGAAPRAFRPGTPALDLFPSALWARVRARSLAGASAAMLEGGAAAGHLPLREAIATHVSAARGVRCGAGQVFITAGTQQAFEETARLVLDPGDEAWLEEPGYLGARAALLSAGARLVPVAVDEQGLDVARGIALAPDARLAVVAPSHQYPLGVTTSLTRRLALLRWAAGARAVILEDDYDSEFRHRGHPLSTLQGLDSAGCVVYVGTFSKTMYPGLRLGFLVAPERLVDAFAAARRGVGPASVLDQAALARFIADGHFATHVRRMRAVYRERSQALLEALRADCAGALDPGPSECGMQMPAFLRGRLSAARVRDQAALRGVEVSALSDYCVGRPGRAGLVLGFGCVRPSAMRAGTQRLAQAIEAAGAGR